MIDIVWLNNFGPNGYGICGRMYVEILHNLGYKVKPTYPYLDPRDPLYKLSKTKVENPLVIMHTIPTALHEAYYTVTEVKKPPDNQAFMLQNAKFIMTQSRFCKKSFGRVTTKEKIHVVNFPFLGDMFKPTGPSYKLNMPEKYNFIFFTVARVDIRKNLVQMMKAFKEEFAGDPDVCLVMKMGSDRYCIPTIFFQHELPENILWMRDFVPDTSMLYRSVNAYIATDCGEGWGAPTTESMLCGIPTIAPRHSGHLDYMNEDNSFLIDVGDWEFIGQRSDNLYPELLCPHLQWKVPNFEDIRKKMRLCYEKYKDMKREEVLEDQMIKNALKVKEITSQEFVGKQLKSALDWYESEYR